MVRSRHDRVAVLFLLIVVTAIVSGEKCNTSDLRKAQCPENEACKETDRKTNEGSCECLPGFTRAERLCVKKEGEATNGSGSHIAAIILTSLSLAVFAVVAVYYGRKYRFVSWVRYRVKRHISNYDDVMIGQDD